MNPVNDTWVVVDGQGQVGVALGVLGKDGAAVTALVVGTRDLADQTGQIVGDVKWIDTGGTPTEAWADAAATLVHAAGPAVVTASATTGGRALLGAIATRLEASLVSQVLTLNRDGSGVDLEQSDLDGRVIMTLHATVPMCALIGAGDTGPAPHHDPAVGTSSQAAPGAIELVKVEPAPGSGSQLTGADRVVSVGLGLGSADAMGAVEQLAQALDAELACSMPVMTLGWLPAERYVGMSGQQISPELYIALGISGAPQHIAGMRNSKTVVAINTDARAPIFRTAAYGIVGDVRDIVPALTAALGA